MTSNNDIGEIFRERFKDFEELPHPSVWRGIKRKIVVKKIIKISSIMITTAAVISGLVFCFAFGKNGQVNNDNLIVKNNGANKEVKIDLIGTQKIDAVDSLVIFNSNVQFNRHTDEIVKLEKELAVNLFSNVPIVSNEMDTVVTENLKVIPFKKDSNNTKSVKDVQVIVGQKEDKDQVVISQVIIDTAIKEAKKIVPFTVIEEDTNAPVTLGKTLFSKNIKYRGYVGIDFQRNRAFENTLAIDFNMGTVINNKLQLGMNMYFGYGEGIENSIVRPSDKVSLSSLLVGGEIGYNVSPNKLVSFVPYFKYRIGSLFYDYDNPNEEITYLDETIHNAEVGANIYLNVSPSFRLGAKVGYNQSSYVNEIEGLSNKDLSGLNMGVSLQFHTTFWRKKKVLFNGREYPRLVSPSFVKE